ncbi:DUF4301 family protein [Gillisia sp. M10.2A]|uniref:DUF4301 family protein n=1 Tax=Gillisia lutea TaxID=2909668 RepID=A0ABS9EC13_9FLAO|nr:DUF4301 family protein [Gillisia lutea]MCF4100431.1 DUF4301 family protein [Gillisia lutea]
MKFSKADLTLIGEKGISVENVQDQLNIFKRGNVAVDIQAAATVGNGIKAFSDDQITKLASFYDANKNKLNILKFVPASGAATRMFKALHAFMEEFDPKKESLPVYLNKPENTSLEKFFSHIEKLPFYKQALKYASENYSEFDTATDDIQKYLLVKSILFSPGLDLSNYPKGLVPFHKYQGFTATAFEEHLYEAAQYAEVVGVAKLHFTVSEGHKEKFETEFERIQSRVENATNTKFKITYSYQDPKTDTIAAAEDNTPFRTADGNLFFRPGGHGALIENLNQLDTNLVFIKNIDNVVTSSHSEEVAGYKKMLAGLLLKMEEQCFSFLELLDNNEVSEEEINRVLSFLGDELFVEMEAGFEKLSKTERIEHLKDRLNRPLRVCGMVKNEGEPGGGPFLVKMENGIKSLQIIEGAQIDQKDSRQQDIAQNATHFNPVDLVCGLKNYKGKSFDLHKYVDPATSFIASKTKEGKELKALERPGLWNGAMAKWNTIFVEVPVCTFNPVKTVADLLKDTHQVN